MDKDQKILSKETIYHFNVNKKNAEMNIRQLVKKNLRNKFIDNMFRYQDENAEKIKKSKNGFNKEKLFVNLIVNKIMEK